MAARVSYEHHDSFALKLRPRTEVSEKKDNPYALAQSECSCSHVIDEK